jgi:ketosteroid isomerase-like protein
MEERLPIILLVLLLAVPFGCQKQGQDVGKASEARIAADVAVIKALNEEFVRLYNAEDFDRLVAVFYAEKAVLMPLGAPVQIGKEAILRWLREDSQKNIQHIDSSVVEDVRVSGDVAVARGVDAGTTTPRSGGEAAPYGLRWLIVFERQPDGTWKCIDEIANENPRIVP